MISKNLPWKSGSCDVMFRIERTVARLTCSRGADQSKSNVYLGWKICSFNEVPHGSSKDTNLSRCRVWRELTGMRFVDIIPVVFGRYDVKNVARNRHRVCCVGTLGQFVSDLLASA
jgi:hypothetical protein